MRLLLSLCLLLPFSLGATTFTEFYCHSTVGTNINSGSTTNAVASYTSVNGNWDGTSVFTPTDGTYPANTNGVAVGAWMAVYIDGATNLIQTGSGGFIAMITNIAAGANGAITIDRAAFSGTAPSSSATARSVKVGGAWNGPYGTIGFPFGFIANTATNAPGVVGRVNFKNAETYNITATATHALNGPVLFSGCASTPGDLGKATINGGLPGTGFNMINLSGSYFNILDLIICSNGTSGNTYGISIGNYSKAERVVVHDIAGGGMMIPNGIAVECEAYKCNTANIASRGGFSATTVGLLKRTISHDNNNAANSAGFTCNANAMLSLEECVSYNNRIGLQHSGVTLSANNSDFYSNSVSGIVIDSTTPTVVIVYNCNFLKNTFFGITNSWSKLHTGNISRCGFGSGTQANGSGTISPVLDGINDNNDHVTYTANMTPWTDPVNGNFSINLAEAKSVGLGSFLQSTVNSPTNTVGYFDIGAAQSASTNAAAGGGSACTFAQ